MRTTKLALAVLVAAALASGCAGGRDGATDSAPTDATAPVASFAVSPAAPTGGQAVSFTDTSTGAPTAWSWSFGNGAKDGPPSRRP